MNTIITPSITQTIRTSGALLVSVLVLYASAGFAVTTEKGVATKPFQHGLLWSISKDGEHIGHIFGTLHTNNMRVTKIPRKVIEVLNASDNFCMETFPGVRYFNPHWGFKSIINDMMLEDGGKLVDLVGKPTYERIEQQLLTIGLKKERIERLKPWAVMHTLSGIYHKKGQTRKGNEILDSILYEIAVKNSNGLYQLETLEELMAAYYAFPMDAQVALLKDRLNSIKKIDTDAKKMVDEYLEQDLQAMLTLATDFISSKSRKQNYDEVYLKHVLYIRNVVMAHYMLAPLRKKNTFIAIGALHLYGEQGVLRLLEDYGYTVASVALKWSQ